MMTIIFSVAVMLSVWVIGFKIITSDEMLLGNFGKWAAKKAETNMIYDALFVCQWCMPNAHSLLVYPLCYALGLIPDGWGLKYVWMHPFCVGASSFICGMSWLAFTSVVNWNKKCENEQKYFYWKGKNEKSEYKIMNDGEPTRNS